LRAVEREERIGVAEMLGVERLDGRCVARVERIQPLPEEAFDRSVLPGGRPRRVLTGRLSKAR
jgi:hypothetical protein